MAPLSLRLPVPVRAWRTALLAALGLLAAALPALPDERRARVPMLPRYQQECGACHTAYAPGLLPASSWQRVMAGLTRHYGSDASLDDATRAELAEWLRVNAASGKRAAEEPPQDRITRAAWFAREHDEVSPATWRLPAVKSAAQCTACHTRADQGSFGERDLRVPR